MMTTWWSHAEAAPQSFGAVSRSGGASEADAAGCIHEARPRAEGKFLFVGEEKFYVRGVTYGTFRPNGGHEFPSPDRVERDFAAMQSNGINAVRTYTPPPLWFLDAAQRYGLRVMVGLPIERSIAFLDYRKCARSIRDMVRAEVAVRAGHPAILCYTIGNEIPASIVRWHGAHKLEHFLERLYQVAKAEDPTGLVSYANYPSTEYLQLPFLDFLSFNVYLESQPRFDAYLARLHNIAGERPMLMAEIGLDSLRHGENTQAETLDRQIRTAFAAGCAGVFVYAWTDEWFRGGAEVDDWAFGLTTRSRTAKPALEAVRKAFAQVPVLPEVIWPRISVVVCTHNGARTIRDTCEGLLRLTYSDYEIIIVDDGSTDDSAAIALEYGFNVIRTENRGLSSARNTGLEAATGEIVAYLDDDAYPDPHWLTYLAASFNSPNPTYAAIGGPNLAPPHDGPIAQCVACSPGGPVHVLLSDREAEHIPGCNMAFRKSCLQAVGGFDPQFRAAGDDVDVCWRLQERGWILGFSPVAVVWHHRRNSVRAYLRQQKGYGRAEAMLERKWPEKYNGVGHPTWNGRIYDRGAPYIAWRAGRIYHGRWGLAPFQYLYEPPPSLIESLPLIPEWYLVVGTLILLSALSGLWPPLHFALVPLALAVGVPLVQAIRSAAHVSFTGPPTSLFARMKLRLLIACLHLLQPMARLWGRLRHGLTIWRQRVGSGLALPRRWTADLWSKRSVPVEERIGAIAAALRSNGASPCFGGDFDPWDIEVRGGLLGAARMFVAIEHHGDGRQLLRIRAWPRCSWSGLTLTGSFAMLSFGSIHDHCWAAGLVLAGITLVLGLRTLLECAAATGALLAGVKAIDRKEKQ